jgi:hypothetical protein
MIERFFLAFAFLLCVCLDGIAPDLARPLGDR